MPAGAAADEDEDEDEDEDPHATSAEADSSKAVTSRSVAAARRQLIAPAVFSDRIRRENRAPTTHEAGERPSQRRAYRHTASRKLENMSSAPTDRIATPPLPSMNCMRLRNAVIKHGRLGCQIGVLVSRRFAGRVERL